MLTDVQVKKLDKAYNKVLERVDRVVFDSNTPRLEDGEIDAENYDILMYVVDIVNQDLNKRENNA